MGRVENLKTIDVISAFCKTKQHCCDIVTLNMAEMSLSVKQFIVDY